MASQVPPKKNTAFNLGLCLYKSDGTFIANPGTITAKISKDFGDYADVGTVSEEDSTYGQIKLALTNTEMNADVVMLYVVDNTSGCVPFTQTIYTATALLDDIKTDTAAILADTGTDGVIVGALNAAAVTDTEDAVWDALRSAHTDAGSFGDVDTTADVADAVWDEDITEHTTADSAGEAMGDAATGGDPWDTALPGAYADGSAGKILSDILVDTGTDGVVIGSDALADLGIITAGTAQSATSTTLVLAASTGFANDELLGATIVITGGTGIGQSRTITDYVASTDTATVDTWTTTPSGTITYTVFGTPPNSVSYPIPANVVEISGDSTAADNLEAAADGTGYNLGGGDVVAASVTGAVGSVASGGITYGSFASGAVAFKKATALAKFPFVLRDSTTHAPASGRSVTATRSIDGAPFAAGTLSAVTDVGSGVYTVDFATGDLNGATIVLKCTATASDTTFVSIVTNP